MIRINDIDYDGPAIREHRAFLIPLRDAAIETAKFDWAVVLSVTIGLLEELAKLQDNERVIEELSKENSRGA